MGRSGVVGRGGVMERGGERRRDGVAVAPEGGVMIGMGREGRVVERERWEEDERESGMVCLRS